MTVELTVAGMTCQGCESVVEHAVSFIEGVDTVEADRYGGVVVVEGTEIDEAAVAEKVEMAGYNAGS